jgi:AcrR family transcriptional regulator
MGIKERRIRQKEEVRSSILSTAWQMVKSDGWQSLSIRKIADAIEYSVPVIYDHFENKEAILFEFGKEGYRLLSKKVQLAKEKHTDPADQLKAIAEAYWSFAFKNKEYYQLMYGVGMACCESGKCMPEKDSFNELLMDTITQLIAKSKNPNANACLKYHTFWSILLGLISIKIMGNSNVPEKLNKMILEDAINGFIRNLD